MSVNRGRLSANLNVMRLPQLTFEFAASRPLLHGHNFFGYAVLVYTRGVVQRPEDQSSLVLCGFNHLFFDVLMHRSCIHGNNQLR